MKIAILRFLFLNHKGFLILLIEYSKYIDFTIVLIKKESHLAKEIYQSRNDPTNFWIFTCSGVSNAKRTIYISGQVAINTDGQIVGIGDLATQTRQVFENIKSALETSELRFNDVVKLTFFLTDISQMATVRDIRDQYIDTKKSTSKFSCRS